MVPQEDVHKIPAKLAFFEDFWYFLIFRVLRWKYKWQRIQNHKTIIIMYFWHFVIEKSQISTLISSKIHVLTTTRLKSPYQRTELTTKVQHFRAVKRKISKICTYNLSISSLIKHIRAKFQLHNVSTSSATCIPVGWTRLSVKMGSKMGTLAGFLNKNYEILNKIKECHT